MPFSIRYGAVGTHKYYLDTVRDSLGNVAQLNDSKEVEVIGRASFNFKTCGPGRAASLLIGPSPSTKLPIASQNLDNQKSAWTLGILNRETGVKEMISTSSSSGELAYIAKHPGTYEIFNAQGEHCQGIVLSPEICRVIEQPKPQANISWQELHEW